jgi:hypothetical protein
MPGRRPSEGAFLVAEQFGFQQLLRNSPAVYSDEGLIAPWTGLVDRFGQKLLARSGLAIDEYSDIGLSH